MLIILSKTLYSYLILLSALDKEIRARQKNYGDSKPPWKILRLISWLSDLMIPFAWDIIRFIINNFIL